MIGIVSGVKVYDRPGKTGFARAFHIGRGRGTFSFLDGLRTETEGKGTVCRRCRRHTTRNSISVGRYSALGTRFEAHIHAG